MKEVIKLQRPEIQKQRRLWRKKYEAAGMEEEKILEKMWWHKTGMILGVENLNVFTYDKDGYMGEGHYNPIGIRLI